MRAALQKGSRSCGDCDGLWRVDPIIADDPFEHLSLIGPAGCEHRAERTVHKTRHERVGVPGSAVSFDVPSHSSFKPQVKKGTTEEPSG